MEWWLNGKASGLNPDESQRCDMQVRLLSIPLKRALSSAGKSAAVTSRRPLVRVQQRPPMMGHKGKLVGGAEYDALTGWKRLIAWRSGERAWIKQRYNKRQRALARAGLRRWRVEMLAR